MDYLDPVGILDDLFWPEGAADHFPVYLDRDALQRQFEMREEPIE